MTWVRPGESITRELTVPADGTYPTAKTQY